MSWDEVALAEAVEKCCDVNDLAIINGKSLSQLMVASYHGNPQFVLDLLEVQEVNVDLQNDDGRHALMCASELGHHEIVQSILKHSQHSQKLVNLPDRDGITALMLASKGNYTKTALILLQNGALVDAQDNKGWSALMIASMHGCTSAVSLLIRNGANVNLQSKDRHSSLSAANKHDHDQVVSILVEKGAHVTGTGMIIESGEAWPACEIVWQPYNT